MRQQLPPAPKEPRGATKQQVLAALDNEMRYASQLPPDRRVDEDHSVGDYLTFIATYLRLAQDALTKKPSDVYALHEVRKLGGLCLSCLMEHGAPERQW